MEHDGRYSPSPAGSPRGPLLSSGFAAADALALAEEALATYMCATSSSGAPNGGASLTTSSSVAPSAPEQPLFQAGDKRPPTPADLLVFLATGSVGQGPDGTGDGLRLFDALVADAMSEFRRDAVAEEESRRVKALELMEASLRTTASAAATPGSRSRGLRGKLRRAFTASHALAGGSRSGSPYATAASSPRTATLATVASFSLLHLDASRTAQAHHFAQSPRKGVSPLRLPITTVAGEASNSQSPAATLRSGSLITAKLGATTSVPSPRVASQQPAKQNSPPAADLLGTFCAGAGSVVSSGASNRMAGSLHSQVLLQKRLVKRDVVPLRTPLALPAFYASRPKRHGQLVKQQEGIFLPPAAASCAAGDTITTTTGSALAASASHFASPDVPHARAATPNLESRCLYRTEVGDGRPRTPFSLLADLSQLSTKRSVWTPHVAMPRAETPQSPPSPVEFAASSPSRRRSGRPPSRISSQPRLSVQQRLQLHYSSEEAVIIATERQREAHRLGYSLRDDASLLASTVRHQRADRPRAHSPYSAPVVPPRPTLSKV
jgi:hypothetical protein